MGRTERLENHLKAHDYNLYVSRREGKLCVMRKSTRVEYYDVDGVSIGFVRPAPHFIIALTKDWTLRGESVDWGFEPILNHLKAIDLWNRDQVKMIEAQQVKDNESADRELANSNESFLKDYRRQFAKTFDWVNTANLDKKRDSRRIQDGCLK